MPEQDNLADKFGELFNTVKNAGEKIAQAFQENIVSLDTFNSIERETLNFDLLEEDIKKIHIAAAFINQKTKITKKQTFIIFTNRFIKKNIR